MQVTHSTTFRPRTKHRFGVKNDAAKLDNSFALKNESAKKSAKHEKARKR